MATFTCHEFLAPAPRASFKPVAWGVMNTPVLWHTRCYLPSHPSPRVVAPAFQTAPHAPASSSCRVPAFPGTDPHQTRPPVLQTAYDGRPAGLPASHTPDRGESPRQHGVRGGDRRRAPTTRRRGRHHWAAARTMAWLNRNRRLSIRCERREEVHHAVLTLRYAGFCFTHLQKTF